MAIYSIKSYIAKGYRNILDGRLKAVVDCSTTASLGRRITVKVGTQTLSTNVYENDRNGLLSEVQYGNGGKVGYTYDEFDRLTGVKYDGEANDRYEYKYGANGMADEVEDHNLGRIARTDYDQADRPCQTELRDSATGEALYKTGLKYNKLNQLEVFSEKAGSESHKSEYAYDRDNRVTGITYDGGSQKVNYTYDELGRVATRLAECGADAGKLTSAYEYVDGGFGTNSTTPLVKKIAQNGVSFEYAYDSRGNIISEKRNGVETTYAYDSLGQLIRVNDPHLNQTWVYNYDRGGNILSKVRYAYTTGTLGTALETIPYAYGDSNWKDKLTAYNGKSIAYDAIGNPLTDGTWTYQWQASRQLKQMTKSGTTIHFKYDHNGLRVGKVVNGTKTKYMFHGKLVTHLTVGSDSLHFFYDTQSRPAKVSFNGTIYIYIHNLQGDVVGCPFVNDVRPIERSDRGRLKQRRGLPRAASASQVARQLIMAQIGRFPAENGHGNVVASAQVSLHLKLQIVQRIEAQGIVESFLIAAMAALDLAVVPRRSGTDGLVGNAVFHTKQLQWMHALCLCRMAKLAAVVGLYDLRRIAEEGDGALHKIHRREAALLFIRIDKPLPAGFFNHCVLEKHIAVPPDVADLRHMLHVHLPLYAQFGGRIVLSEVLRLLFRRFRFPAVSQPYKDAI